MRRPTVLAVATVVAGVLLAALALVSPGRGDTAPNGAPTRTQPALAAGGTRTARSSVHASSPPGTRTVELRAGHRNRSYLLLPAGRAAAPLVVLLHGSGSTAQAALARTGFGSLAAADGFAVAAPASVGDTWNSGDGCCDLAVADHVDDVAFVAEVITDARRRTSVDPARTYVVGYSNGGKLGYEVTCADPDVAALATYGAGPQSGCTSTRPVSLIAGFGTADRLEPPAGKPANSRGQHPGLAQTLAAFTARDGCSGRGALAQSGRLGSRTWSACAAGTAVVGLTWSGQNHRFPAGAAAQMWAFLADHTQVPQPAPVAAP